MMTTQCSTVNTPYELRINKNSVGNVNLKIRKIWMKYILKNEIDNRNYTMCTY